jgi:hypothetical protein
MVRIQHVADRLQRRVRDAEVHRPEVSPISSVKLVATTISLGVAMLANCGCISERWYSSSSG